MKDTDDLFPHVPIVSVTTRRPPGEALAAGRLTGLLTLSDHRKTVELALRLHPNTKEIFVVSGTLEQLQKTRADVARAGSSSLTKATLKISYLTDWSPDELIAKTKNVAGKGPLVLYVWQHNSRLSR